MTSESTLEMTSQTGPEMASDPDILGPQKPMVQNRPYLTVLLDLLREKGSRPEIGYARLLVARNMTMVVNSTDSQQVINLGHKPRP